jgi:heme oxygenase
MAVARSVEIEQACSGCMQLKHATRSVHEALHRAPLLAAFEHQQLDIAGYLRMMRVFHDFYIWLDPLICRSMPLLGHHAHGFTYTPRAPMFARDISDLEPRCPEHQHQPQPGARSGRQLPLDTAGALAGALYVVEGSILGGSGLDRCARSVLQSHGSAGRSYWQWCRNNARHRWLATRQIVDQVWLSQGSGDLMADSAMRVFADLLERFEREGVAGSAGLEAAQ